MSPWGRYWLARVEISPEGKIELYYPGWAQEFSCNVNYAWPLYDMASS